MNRRDSRRKVQEQISIRERRTLELKSLLNTFADVSMLPRELLVDIFLLVQDNLPIKEWHQIAHVCRHWRDTALSAPILWTEPPTHLQEYTNLMLERSGTAKLSISIETWNPVPTDTIQSLVRHADHIHALKLHVGAPQQLRKFFEHFVASGKTLPRLQSLDAHSFHLPAPALPSNLFPQSSPISNLRLHRVRIDWQILQTLDLVSLDLYNVTLRAKISAATFLDTLRNMPRLQRLIFTTDFISRTSDEASQLHLPHLRNLTIGGRDHVHISYLLARLELPSLEELSLCTNGELGPVTSYSHDMLSPVAKTLAAGNFRAGEKLSVENNRIVVDASNQHVVDVWLCPSEDEPDVESTILCMQFLLQQIVPIFVDLTEVDIVLPLESGDLIDTFGSLRHLRRFTFWDYTSLVPAFTNALTSHSGPASDQATHPFPSLNTIYYKYMPWSEVSHDDATNLCHALIQRAAQATLVVGVKPRLPGWISKLLKGGGIEVKTLSG